MLVSFRFERPTDRKFVSENVQPDVYSQTSLNMQLGVPNKNSTGATAGPSQVKTCHSILYFPKVFRAGQLHTKFISVGLFLSSLKVHILTCLNKQNYCDLDFAWITVREEAVQYM